MGKRRREEKNERNGEKKLNVIPFYDWKSSPSIPYMQTVDHQRQFRLENDFLLKVVFLLCALCLRFYRMANTFPISVCLNDITNECTLQI